MLLAWMFHLYSITPFQLGIRSEKVHLISSSFSLLLGRKAFVGLPFLFGNISILEELAGGQCISQFSILVIEYQNVLHNIVGNHDDYHNF